MTFRTILGISSEASLVCWPEENDQLSVVSAKKIASPHLDDLTPKRFEKNLWKVVAIGPEVDMKAKLEEMEEVESLEQEGEADEQPPPKKKPKNVRRK